MVSNTDERRSAFLVPIRVDPRSSAANNFVLDRRFAIEQFVQLNRRRSALHSLMHFVREHSHNIQQFVLAPQRCIQFNACQQKSQTFVAPLNESISQLPQ